MDAFWCILLSTIVLRWAWKSNVFNIARKRQPDKIPPIEFSQTDQNKKPIDKETERDIAELRKRGFTDDLIAMIIPTINNGE